MSERLQLSDKELESLRAAFEKAVSWTNYYDGSTESSWKASMVSASAQLAIVLAAMIYEATDGQEYSLETDGGYYKGHVAPKDVGSAVRNFNGGFAQALQNIDNQGGSSQVIVRDLRESLMKYEPADSVLPGILQKAGITAFVL